MSRPKPIAPHAGYVTPAERARLFKQHPATVWLTGLSGAGMGTLAYALEARLVGTGHACCVLDVDACVERVRAALLPRTEYIKIT
jgi:adenylylsulfate kinase